MDSITAVWRLTLGVEVEGGNVRALALFQVKTVSEIVDPDPSV